MDAIQRLANQLATLLDDKDFNSEVRAYKKAYQRLRVRLRNNQLIAVLKNLATLMRQLRERYSAEIIKTCANQLKNDDVKKKKKSLGSLQRHILDFIEYLDKSLGKTVFVYAYTQQHFRLGHLIHHIIVLRTCVARFRFCLKALLVYSCDLYIEISNLKMIDCPLTKDSLDDILIRNECKPRNLSAVIEIGSQTNATNTEGEIGQLIDRDTMEVKTRARAKRIKIK